MKLRAELEESSENRESQNSNPWSEFVVDLWSIRLKHIQKEPFGDKVVVDSTTGHYGFGSKSGSEGMEERLFDLENKGDEVKSRDSIVTVDLAKKDFVDTAVTKKSDIDQSTDKEESEIEKKAMKPTRTQAKKSMFLFIINLMYHTNKLCTSTVFPWNIYTYLWYGVLMLEPKMLMWYTQLSVKSAFVI